MLFVSNIDFTHTGIFYRVWVCQKNLLVVITYTAYVCSLISNSNFRGDLRILLIACVNYVKIRRVSISQPVTGDICIIITILELKKSSMFNYESRV